MRLRNTSIASAPNAGKKRNLRAPQKRKGSGSTGSQWRLVARTTLMRPKLNRSISGLPCKTLPPGGRFNRIPGGAG
jgi:hypothetical protein